MGYSYAIDSAVATLHAVDGILSAGDNQSHHRPHEMPANMPFLTFAADAVDVLVNYLRSPAFGHRT